MEEQLKQAQTAVYNLLNTLRNLSNVEVIEGIKPKFRPGQNKQ